MLGFLRRVEICVKGERSSIANELPDSGRNDRRCGAVFWSHGRCSQEPCTKRSKKFVPFPETSEMQYEIVHKAWRNHGKVKYKGWRGLDASCPGRRAQIKGVKESLSPSIRISSWLFLSVGTRASHVSRAVAMIPIRSGTDPTTRLNKSNKISRPERMKQNNRDKTICRLNKSVHRNWSSKFH